MSLTSNDAHFIWMAVKILGGCAVSCLALVGWPNRKRIRIPLLLIANATQLNWHLGIYFIVSWDYGVLAPESFLWLLPFWEGTLQGTDMLFSMPHNTPACFRIPAEFLPWYHFIRWLAFPALLLFIPAAVKELGIVIKTLWLLNQKQRQRLNLGH
jgi:hypothetical protein